MNINTKDPTGRAWLDSAPTQHALGQATDRVNALRLELEKACRETTDPSVAAAFARFEEGRKLVMFFHGGDTDP